MAIAPETTPGLSYVHRFEPATVPGRLPLLLLHGTGGDEHDLIEIGRAVAPGAALLAPRGNVLEGGMPRFFRRLAEGIFDEADVRRRAAELAGFVAAAREHYQITAPIALGFSNGANIAAAVLQLHPGTLAGAVLLRPMVPLSAPPDVSLQGTPVLMLSGTADPIVPSSDPDRLAATLLRAGAKVEHRRVPGGHGLTSSDLAMAKSRLDALRNS